MIKRPCFDVLNDKMMISECDGCNTSRHPLSDTAIEEAWSGCGQGKTDPWYSQWQRMGEQPAAGPWRHDVDSAPEDCYVAARYEDYWCKAKRQGRVWTDEGHHMLRTPIAWAEVNLPEKEES